jgi:biopolymer transport protein TolR
MVRVKGSCSSGNESAELSGRSTCTPTVNSGAVTINSKGEIFIQESKVEYEKIIAKVLAVSKNRTDTRIYVRGDKTINYGRVLEIMGLLSGSGFTKVALISEPYKER